MIDSLSNQSYLKHLNQFPLMSAEDELTLGRQVQEGSESARTEFIQRNLKLVISIAGRYRARGVDFADLVEEGNLGLMRAVDKFDPEMGYRFSTYAAWWIRQAVERAIMNQRKTVRTPIHKQREYWAQRRAAEADRDSQDPGFAPRGFDQWFGPSEQIISLDQPIDEEESLTAVDLLISEDEGPEAHAIAADQVALVSRWVALLPEQHRMVLTRRYGLDGRDAETLLGIGERMGMTRERIRQIQAEGLHRLRQLVMSGRISVDAALL